MLEAHVHSKPKPQIKKVYSSPRTSLVAACGKGMAACPLCQESHYIGKCEKFIKSSTQQRLKTIQSHRMCSNCLSASHTHHRNVCQNMCVVSVRVDIIRCFISIRVINKCRHLHYRSRILMSQFHSQAMPHLRLSGP